MNISTVSMITFSAKKNRFLNQQPKNYEVTKEGVRLYVYKSDSEKTLLERNAYILLAFSDTPSSFINSLIGNLNITGAKPRCFGCAEIRLDRNTFSKMNQEERNKFADEKIKQFNDGILLVSSGTKRDCSGRIYLMKEK